MIEQYSSRVRERILSPLFKKTESDKGDFLATFGENDFAYVYQIANSNGEINFFGKVEDEYPRKLKSCYYETNIHGPALAYLDALVELLTKREWPGIHQTLRLKEVESFLRDTNEVNSFGEDEHSHFRIHECLTGLESYLQDRFLLSTRVRSPEFKESENLLPFYDKTLRGSFFSVLTNSEQFHLANEIFDNFIREFLQRDGGGVDLCHISDGLVSIAYSGNCSECSSSLASTLEYIQKTLRFHLQEPNLLVVTDS